MVEGKFNKKKKKHSTKKELLKRAAVKDFILKIFINIEEKMLFPLI